MILNISVKYEDSLNRLNKELAKWISTINTDTLFKKRFVRECRFISFNYTETLENRYSVETEKICYIHGTVKDGNIMFGCSREDVIAFQNYSFDYLNDSSLAKQLKIILSHKFKKVQETIDCKVIPFLSNMNFDRIIVLGLGFSQVDM